MVTLIFNFFSNHFEWIVATNIFLVICLGALLGVAHFREALSLRWLRKAVREVLHFGIVAVQVGMLSVMIWIFVANLGDKPILDDQAFFIENTTAWVKDRLEIYVIAGQDLVVMSPDGQTRLEIVHAPDPIREYHFSPDGRYLLVVTERALMVTGRHGEEARTITELKTGEGRKGVINGVSWSPDSRRFCFREALWSSYSSEDRWFVYDLSGGMSDLQVRGLKITSLKWDAAGESLYFPWFETLNNTQSASRYQIKLYKIPLDTLRPELMLRTFWDQPVLSPEHLAVRGIHLFDSGRPLSFGLSVKQAFPLISSTGEKVGIDRKDYLWYTREHWWRRRLFRIPRLPAGNVPYDQRPRVVDHMRWLPSGRYVIMEHYLYGILILDPAKNRVGILSNTRGATFGWYEPPPAK